MKREATSVSTRGYSGEIGDRQIDGEKHFVPAQSLFDAQVAYTGIKNLKLALGVKNLTDLENGDIRKTSFTTLSSGANVYRYSYVMPPQYDLSVTMDF